MVVVVKGHNYVSDLLCTHTNTRVPHLTQPLPTHPEEVWHAHQSRHSNTLCSLKKEVTKYVGMSWLVRMSYLLCSRLPPPAPLPSPPLLTHTPLTWVWVRPILTISWNSVIFSAREACSSLTPGIRHRWISMAVATCMAVGKVSLELWLRFTWSLGWTGVLDPSSPPNSSMALYPTTRPENKQFAANLYHNEPLKPSKLKNGSSERIYFQFPK